MGDLSDAQSALTIKVVGANPSTGTEDNFAEVDTNGGQIIAGEGTAGSPVGGVVSVQGVTGGTALPVIQSEKVSTNNSSTANLASAATFTGTSDNILGYGSISVSFKADQQCTIQVQQSTDNSNWDYVSSYVVAASTGDSRAFRANGNYARVLVTNNGGSTTTLLRLQTILSPVGEALPTALSGGGQLKAADVIDTSATHAALSVTTSASEAKVGATRLLNRKMLSITPTNGTIYWGATSGVTTASGTPIFKNQTASFAFTDNVAIWLIAGGTTDVRIVEAS